VQIDVEAASFAAERPLELAAAGRVSARGVVAIAGQCRYPEVHCTRFGWRLPAKAERDRTVLGSLGCRMRQSLPVFGQALSGQRLQYSHAAGRDEDATVSHRRPL